MDEYLITPEPLVLPLYFRNECLDLTLKYNRYVCKLPEKQGCYLLMCSGYVLYVGQTENLKLRWRSHHIKKLVKGLVQDGEFSDQFYLLYYLTDTSKDIWVRKTLEKFLIHYYRPILNYEGDPYFILPTINSDIQIKRFNNIHKYCDIYYKDRINSFGWPYRCDKFYMRYHRFLGTFESCKEQVLQISNIKKCVDVSPFFSYVNNLNNSVIYAKFEEL